MRSREPGSVNFPAPRRKRHGKRAPMDIYLNGQMVPPDRARVGLDDAGLQHAVGLFETMASYQGKVFRLDAHLARLANSARELGLSAELNTAPLADAVRKTILHNQIDRARIRLTLTPG